MKLRICLCCLLLLALPVSAMAAEVESGGVYCFSQEDFGEDTAVFLRQVPENGTLTHWHSGERKQGPRGGGFRCGDLSEFAG